MHEPRRRQYFSLRDDRTLHSSGVTYLDHVYTAGVPIDGVEVEGVSFLDWLTRYVAGADVELVACTDRGEPGTGDDRTG